MNRIDRIHQRNQTDQMNQRDQKDQTDEQEAVAGMAATPDMIGGTGKFHSERTRQGRGAYALSLEDC